MNKLLHQPMTVLKKTQNDGNGTEYVDAVRELFNLPSPQHDSDEN